MSSSSQLNGPNRARLTHDDWRFLKKENCHIIIELYIYIYIYIYIYNLVYEKLVYEKYTNPLTIQQIVPLRCSQTCVILAYVDYVS